MFFVCCSWVVHKRGWGRNNLDDVYVLSLVISVHLDRAQWLAW